VKTILLDTNIFDKLAANGRMCTLLAKLSASGHIRLVVPRTVRDELAASPYQEMLTALPIEVVGNATPVVGIMCAGDYLGDADHYFNHKGASNKENDALVAAAAEFHADWLVSEDHRLIHRQQQLSNFVEALTFEEFVVKAQEIQGTT
jgi:predicted nucleic acid-binding protein